jgi:hypothetical protein
VSEVARIRTLPDNRGRASDPLPPLPDALVGLVWAPDEPDRNARPAPGPVPVAPENPAPRLETRRRLRRLVAMLTGVLVLQGITILLVASQILRTAPPAAASAARAAAPPPAPTLEVTPSTVTRGRFTVKLSGARATSMALAVNLETGRWVRFALSQGSPQTGTFDTGQSDDPNLLPVQPGDQVMVVAYVATQMVTIPQRAQSSHGQ